MSFTEARHRLVLSNVANADTPHYRRQDLDDVRFKRTLERAIRQRDDFRRGAFVVNDDLTVPVSTRGGSLRGRRVTSLPYEGPLKYDENSVSVEREMALLAMNAGRFRSAANLLRKEWSTLKAAISERPNAT